MTSGRAASVVNHKELYFSSHIKMLDLYDDLPHQYNIHKIIYDDTSTLNDLITILKTNENPKTYLLNFTIIINPWLPWSMMKIKGGHLALALKILSPDREPLWVLGYLT